jgi:hypothetical protein
MTDRLAFSTVPCVETTSRAKISVSNGRFQRYSLVDMVLLFMMNQGEEIFSDQF